MDNGRPAVPPEMLFKMLLLGYLYGIPSEVKLAEAKVHHGLRFARMLGIQNMREQCFLTAAVQNIKRLVKAFFPPFSLRFFLFYCPNP